MHFKYARLLMLPLLVVSAAAQDGSEADGLEPAVIYSAEELAVAERDVSDAVSPGDSRRVAANTGAKDELDLDRTEITGNQELPKVLYIVPWKKSEPGDLMGKPVNTLLDEVLAPIDRSEFVRQIRYYEELQKD